MVETYVSTFLIIGITILAVLTISLVAWSILRPNPHPEVLPVSNVIVYKKYERTSSYVRKTYYINFRAVCKNIPATIDEYDIGLIKPNGKPSNYIVHANRYGSGVAPYYYYSNIRVMIKPASSVICGSKDLNKGRDVVLILQLTGYNYYGASYYVTRTHPKYIIMKGHLASGGKWSAIINIPDEVFNIGG